MNKTLLIAPENTNNLDLVRESLVLLVMVYFHVNVTLTVYKMVQSLINCVHFHTFFSLIPYPRFVQQFK